MYDEENSAVSVREQEVGVADRDDEAEGLNPPSLSLAHPMDTLTYILTPPNSSPSKQMPFEITQFSQSHSCK